MGGCSSGESSAAEVGWRRVSVVGNSGSGKSVFAAALAARLGVPHVELDAIFHQPGWQKLEPDEFERRVGEAVAGPAWVTDGNYRAVLDRIWDRADTIVWLDFPRPVVMRRVLWRTLSRAVTRRELWNGNRESWAAIFSRDPDRSIILWAWTQHDTYRERYLHRLAPGERPAGVHVVRLTSPRSARELLAARSVSSSSSS